MPSVACIRTWLTRRSPRRRLRNLRREIREYYFDYLVTADTLELRNLALVADLIIRSALERKESRGLHYTLDYPATNDTALPRDTILVPEHFAGKEWDPRWSDSTV